MVLPSLARALHVGPMPLSFGETCHRACRHSSLQMQDAGSAGDSRQVLIDQACENPCCSLVCHFMQRAQVKSHQKASAAFQKAWHAYCDEHGDGIYDPARPGAR